MTAYHSMIRTTKEKHMLEDNFLERICLRFQKTKPDTAIYKMDRNKLTLKHLMSNYKN